MTEGYPQNLETSKQFYGYGGVRIYPVSRGQAEQIAKEFPKDFELDPPFCPYVEGERLFYMNIDHGERHVIFSINDKTQS